MRGVYANSEILKWERDMLTANYCSVTQYLLYAPEDTIAAKGIGGGG